MPSYEIETIEDLSHIGVKRYVAVILLPKNIREYSREEIISLVEEAVNTVKVSVVHRNPICEKTWGNQQAHIVWLDLFDPTFNQSSKAEPVLQVLWIDPEIDKKYMVSLPGGEENNKILYRWEA